MHFNRRSGISTVNDNDFVTYSVQTAHENNRMLCEILPTNLIVTSPTLDAFQR